MFTAQDIIEYMLASVGGGAQDGEHRAVRMAVVNGVREVLQTRQWLWHTRTGYFNLNDTRTTAYVVQGNPYITVASAAGIYEQRILSFSSAGLFSQLPRVESTSLSASGFIKVNQAAVDNIGYTPAAVPVTAALSTVTLPNGTDMTQIFVNQVISVGADGTNTTYFPQNTKVVNKDNNTRVVTLSQAALATSATDIILNFGTAYEMTAQTFYELPANVKDIDALVTQSVGTLHCYLSPADWQRMETNSSGAGEPYYYTIMRSDLGDNYQIRFVGVPTSGTSVYYTYRYIPEPVKFMGYEATCRQGSVSNVLVITGSANSTTTLSGITDTSQIEIGFVVNGEGVTAGQSVVGITANTIVSGSPVLGSVTLSATASASTTDKIYSFSDPLGLTVFGASSSFPPNQINCVIRFGSATDEADGVGSVTPYVYQREVALRINTLKMRITESLPEQLIGVKYAISDIIDCSPQMYTAILSACEMWYARLAGKAAAPVMEVYKRDLVLAFENDVISPIGGRATTMIAPTPRTAGWYSPSFPDMG